MIAIDTSAIVAIVLGEPELEQFSHIMARELCAIAAPSLTEAAIVLDSRGGADALQGLQLVLQRADIEVHPMDETLAWAAHRAWQRFGKGRHPAGLNLGDCFSYALAKSLGVPLLFKGDDFTQTDISAAI